MPSPKPNMTQAQEAFEAWWKEQTERFNLVAIKSDVRFGWLAAKKHYLGEAKKVAELKRPDPLDVFGYAAAQDIAAAIERLGEDEK